MAELLLFHLFVTGNLDENERKEKEQNNENKGKEPNEKCLNKTPRDDEVMPKEENQSNVGLIIGE